MGAKKKKRRVASSCLAYDVRAEPGLHLALPLQTAAKIQFHSLPTAIDQDQNKLVALLEDMQATLGWFVKYTAGMRNVEPSIDMLSAMIVMLECALPEEHERPSTQRVRLTRKKIFASAQGAPKCGAVGTVPYDVRGV